MWSVKCGVRSGESVKCRVGCVEPEVWSVKCAV